MLRDILVIGLDNDQLKVADVRIYFCVQYNYYGLRLKKGKMGSIKIDKKKTLTLNVNYILVRRES